MSYKELIIIAAAVSVAIAAYLLAQPMADHPALVDTQSDRAAVTEAGLHHHL